jgi:hypothetical protein
MIFPIGLDKDIIFSRYLWFKLLAWKCLHDEKRVKLSGLLIKTISLLPHGG